MLSPPARRSDSKSEHSVTTRSPESNAVGVGINISPTNVDLATLFADELNLVRAAHPDHQIDLEVEGDAQGVWDGRRLQQLLGNLVLNAIKCGAPEVPLKVTVTGEEEEVWFEVKNNGVAIEQRTLERIFDPLRRGPDQENKYDADGNLGLGLYIAREVAKAHGGDIEARSDAAETVFAVRLPRRN